jgi:hypothetical protein
LDLVLPISNSKRLIEFIKIVTASEEEIDSKQFSLVKIKQWLKMRVMVLTKCLEMNFVNVPKEEKTIIEIYNTERIFLMEADDQLNKFTV